METSSFADKMCAAIVFFIFFFLTPSFSYSFELSNLNKKTINIPFSNENITLDGYLTENIWNNAKNIELNLVNSPYNNTPSPVNTQVKIVENGKYLLIAFIAEDPNPKDIQAYYGDRDSRWDDDLVGLKLDSQNNNRMNYEFSVNPLGVQMDSIQNNINNTYDDLWDGIWQSYGRITETGYIVEIQIPFRILNFKSSESFKQWPFELFRMYPRDKLLRISHVPLNKDIACDACQYPLAKGFQLAYSEKAIMVTPSVVIKNEQTRDISIVNDNWQDNTNTDIGIDLRWNIDSNTLVNTTINPDFSFIEADAAQLNVNENFSLEYNEKRPFFIENSQYFTSNFDLIYSRNITAPDYGVKLTGAQQAHTYGIFLTKDNQTNFILPGNLSSDIANVEDENHTAAIKYRFDVNDDLSLGLISTLRKSSFYHNYVAGIDAKYQISESNSLLAQVVTSNTEYPKDLYQDFCSDQTCIERLDVNCLTGNCPYNEQVIRADKTGDFSDKALKLEFHHQSEYWDVDVSHQEIGENFRADLGFMPRADYTEDSIVVNRKFYAQDSNYWQESSLLSTWNIKHNEKGELIEKFINSTVSVDGAYQSRYKLSFIKSNEVGLRHDTSITNIDNNTTLFDLNLIEAFTAFKPTEHLYLEFLYINGDKIDYIHDRKGKLNELESYFSWFATKHLEIEVSHIDSVLSADGSNVYQANLIDSRISYQFDNFNRLKFSIIYCDIERNLDNNPSGLFDKRKKSLSTQLIYSYKINPQTVFYLGYSDNSLQNDALTHLEKEDKTFFTKISYAWVQ